jgi:hypothetical protein
MTDLLAPPKFTSKTYAKWILGFCAVALLVDALFLVFGDVPIRHAAPRAIGVVLIGAASIWSYHRLLRVALRSPPERMPIIHGFIGVVCNATFFTTIATVDPVLDLFEMAWLIPATFGVTLAMGGWTRRIGPTRHCPDCEYEFNFEDHQAPTSCPECASRWLGRLKRGRRVRSRQLIACGVAFAVGSLVVLNPIFLMTTIAPRLPTPALCALLYLRPGAYYKCWEELQTRPLSPEWTARLAQRVLEYRPQHQWVRPPSAWLETAIAAGQVPSDTASHYYGDGFQAALEAPATVKRGQDFQASLRVTCGAEGTARMGIMFAGYTLDDGPPQGREEKMVWEFDLRPEFHTTLRDCVPQTLRADHPGTLHLRAVYWLIYLPQFQDSTWQPDGQPAPIPSARWFERREVERLIKVEP